MAVQFSSRIKLETIIILHCMTQTSIPHASVHFNAISSLFYSISELTLPKKKLLNFITTKVSCGFSPFFQSSRFYVYTYCFIFLDIFKIPFYHQEFLNLLWILLKYFLWIFIFSAQVVHLHNPRKSASLWVFHVILTFFLTVMALRRWIANCLM